MDRSLKHKLIEISFDKGLLSLLILLAGFLVNATLEQNKLINAQRVANTSELVQACSKIWEKIYIYETNLDELDRERWMLDFFNKNKEKLNDRKKRIKEIVLFAEQKKEAIFSLLSENRFVVGEGLVQHFLRYMGLLKMRADIKNEIYSDDREDSVKRSRDAIEELDRQIRIMRFSARDVQNSGESLLN